jgi:hypothetical protein
LATGFFDQRGSGVQNFDVAVLQHQAIFVPPTSATFCAGTAKFSKQRGSAEKFAPEQKSY